MSNYILDTCTVSDFFRGDRSTTSKLQSISPSRIFLSSITVMEILYGFDLNPAIKKKFSPAFESFRTITQTIAFDSKSAESAATLRAILKQNGTPIGAWDLLIAATALTHDFVLVTSNTKEFKNIQTLKLENWR